MRSTFRALSVVLATGTLTFGTLAAVQAASTTVDDGADASASLQDILTMKVTHGDEKVTVRTSYADLRKTSDGGPAGTTIYLDTKAGRKGPEFALLTGLQSGTDYQLVKVKNWKAKHRALTCDHNLKIKWAKDITRFTVDRDCIGEPDRVRVSQKMVDEWDGSHPITDWAPARRKFSAWVTEG